MTSTMARGAISALPPSYSTVRLVRTLEPVSPTLPPLPIQESLELSFEATFDYLTGTSTFTAVLTPVQEDGPPTPSPEPDCPPDLGRPPLLGPSNSTSSPHSPPHSPPQFQLGSQRTPTRPVLVRTRSRSATLPSRQIEEMHEMHELAGELDELPTYAECARDRPPPIGPPVVVHIVDGVQMVHGTQVRSGRSQSLGASHVVGWAPASSREGWVRDSDGQWRQGRRRTVAVPNNPAHPSNYPPSSRSQRTQTSRSLPSRLGLEPRPHPPSNHSSSHREQRPGHGQILLRPRSRQNSEPAGNGKVWRKKLGVWYVARKEGFFVETVGPQGERWRRTLGVWHVVSEP